MCYSCIAEAWLETGDLSRSAAMVDRMVAAGGQGSAPGRMSPLPKLCFEGFLPSREMTAAVLLAGYDDEKQDVTRSNHERIKQEPTAKTQQNRGQ